MNERKAYPSDVSDEEWAFTTPYLTLMSETAPQCEHPLREVFNGLRYVTRGGTPWRMMPNDLPPWHTVYQQTQRWLNAGGFETLVHDLCVLLRLAERLNTDPMQSVSTVAGCNPRWKGVNMPGMTAPSGPKGAKPLSPSIR